MSQSVIFREIRHCGWGGLFEHSLIYCSHIFRKSNTSRPVRWSYKMMRLIGNLTFLWWQHAFEDHIASSAFPCLLENTTRYYQPRFQTERIKYTINQSEGPGHTNFLPGAIISMVYLLTRRFLKAEASWGLSYCVAAAHVTALQPLSASLLSLHCLFGSH